ncbi:PAAR domain-containing protein [Pseudomonas sp. 148P]|uniref:PAAR domain-containing protein n=1 Tax=Pseudomonas ulcerans TaxID=3115852 RepID=A0ABU7HT47_9PSED|nr:MULTISPECIES: PAAR domain-containing protein [unclassified Pseudomonas]MEE1924947.1 PAAR domain-containing protein [Pseudomonas sp. 147P]MEE1934720.1 PAAR domain-containing protein [Pseudomonas sp. 148P]
MAIGYVIRMGDKTSCGGQVLEGNPGILVGGMPQAREGDSVSCGVTGQTYRIVGGVSSVPTNGGLAAGSLDSTSSCPCQATLLPGCQSFPYKSNSGTPTSRQHGPGTRPRDAEAAAALQQASVSGVTSRTSPAQRPGASTPFQDSTQAVEPGFHIVPYSMSRSALEAALFDSPSLEVLSKFRTLNPGQGTIKAGAMIILSDPRNRTCTREEALLMEAAEIVNKALEPLTEEEADFMARHHEEISTFLAHTAAAVGVGEAMFSRNLNNVKGNMNAVQDLYTRSFDRDGHLKSTQFFAERARLFADLDMNLSPLTRKAIGFPDHPKLKTALGLSTRSLVHHWKKAGASGPIPGYATHIEQVSRTAKILKAGGWVGAAIGGGASYVKVQQVCTEGSAEACRKVMFTEAGSFFGGIVGGAGGGVAASAGAGPLCVAIGLGTAVVGGVVCGIVVAGVGAYAGGAFGASKGAQLGEVIYQKSR